MEVSSADGDPGYWHWSVGGHPVVQQFADSITARVSWSSARITFYLSEVLDGRVQATCSRTQEFFEDGMLDESRYADGFVVDSLAVVNCFPNIANMGPPLTGVEFRRLPD